MSLGLAKINLLSLHDALPISGAKTYRVEVAGEFRRPLLPTIHYIELRASGLELLRFYGVGNETDGSQPDSVYRDRKSTRLNSSHTGISYAIFCVKKKKSPLPV